MTGDTYRPKVGHILKDEDGICWSVLKAWGNSLMVTMNITTDGMDGHYWEVVFHPDAYDYIPRHSYDYIPWDIDNDDEDYQQWLDDKRSRHRA